MSEFDLNIITGREIVMHVNLCKGWKELVKPIKDNKHYKKQLQEYSNNIAKFSGLERAVIGWDDEWGLSYVDVHYGDRTGLLLFRDNLSPRYYPHNVDTPEQAFTLLATVLKYVHDIRSINIKSNLNWDILPIGLPKEPDSDLWIKINLHPSWKKIVNNLNKNEKFKNFIEECAPFSGERYIDIKKVNFHWDNELGLKSVSVIPGMNGSSLYLETDESNNFYYFSHNVWLPIQAVTLIGSVSKYMEYAKRMQEKKFKE